VSAWAGHAPVGATTAGGSPLMGPPQPAPMRAMFAHITPLEAPIVWLAFFAGAALGAFVTWRVMARRNLARD
jgi:hypothetical protein